MRTGDQIVQDLPWRWNVQGKIFLIGGLGYLFDAWDIALNGFLTPLVGSEGGYLSVTVSSHDQPVPAQLFDDAGAAESQCGTFQLIDKEGTTSWKLSRVAFPQLGDRTYTTRVEATTEGDIFRGGVIQIAGVSVGNNLVYVVYSAGPASRYEPTAVETFAKTTVDNLNAL